MISMGKKYRTRDGRDVRLLCVDGPKLWPVVGIVDGDSHVSCWTLSGKLFDDAEDYRTDLIECHEPDIRTIWVNVYEGFCRSFNSERSARESDLSGSHGSALSIAQPVTFKVERSWKG